VKNVDAATSTATRTLIPDTPRTIYDYNCSDDIETISPIISNTTSSTPSTSTASTTDMSDTPTSFFATPSGKGTIAGISVGTVALAASALFLLFFVYKKRKIDRETRDAVFGRTEAMTEADAYGGMASATTTNGGGSAGRQGSTSPGAQGSGGSGGNRAAGLAAWLGLGYGRNRRADVTASTSSFGDSTTSLGVVEDFHGDSSASTNGPGMQTREDLNAVLAEREYVRQNGGPSGQQQPRPGSFFVENRGSGAFRHLRGNSLQGSGMVAGRMQQMQSANDAALQEYYQQSSGDYHTGGASGIVPPGMFVGAVSSSPRRPNFNRQLTPNAENELGHTSSGEDPFADPSSSGDHTHYTHGTVAPLVTSAAAFGSNGNQHNAEKPHRRRSGFMSDTYRSRRSGPVSLPVYTVGPLSSCAS